MSTALPEELIASLRGLPGFDEKKFLEAHSREEKITSVRLNPFKLSSAFENAEAVKWCSLGRYLAERPSFTFDPLFHAGCYYVQEASSMFIEHLLKNSVDLSKPLRVLDLCAAPGGKSTHIASLLPKESLLVTNEVISIRVNVLSDNMAKWGNENVIVTNNDPSRFSAIENYFDVIVVDAPCSGSGLFRKDNEAINEWNEENVKLCSQRQQRILADVLPALKENGILIYSTCSYSKEENEDVTDKIMNEFPLESVNIKIGSGWNIIESFSDEHKAKGFRFYPDKIKGEGFYATCLRKKENGTAGRHKRSVLKKISAKEEDILKRLLNAANEYSFFKHGDEVHLIRKQHESDLVLLQQHLHLRKAGITLGKIMNGELIPDHQLAMSFVFNDSVQKINVDRVTALKYLKREDIKLPDAKKGWALICFEGHPLGWAKILPNRVNNYYPKELRILKSENNLYL